MYGQQLPKDLPLGYTPMPIMPTLRLITGTLQLVRASPTLCECHLVGTGIGIRHSALIVDALKKNHVMRRLWLSSQECVLHVQDLRGGTGRHVHKMIEYSVARVPTEPLDVAVICALMATNVTCTEFSFNGKELSKRTQLVQMLSLLRDSPRLEHADMRGTGMEGLDTKTVGHWYESL